MTIEIFNRYGDPRRLASRPPQPAQSLADRFEQFLPGLSSTYGAASRMEVLASTLPEGASWAHRSASGASSGGGMQPNYSTVQAPYLPEFTSDRQNYPIHRLLANRYWRMFHKLDPIVGTCTDLISEMPWSNFELTGPGVEGEVRDMVEAMCERTSLLSIFPYLTREWLSIGEVVPHLFFDPDIGIWTHIALHNPDQLEIIDSPFLRMDPIIQFFPDDRLRNVLMSPHPVMQQVRQTLPADVLSRIEAREGITLSPLNATFLARKLHPYESRGTSIYSRLWRIFMYEDAIFNSCFPADTPVLMADGKHKPINLVRVGEKVLDRNGEPAKVIDAWEEPAPAELVVIHLAEGLEPIRCTTNHNFPAIVGGRYVKVAAGELGVGDALRIHKSLANVPGLEMPDTIRELCEAAHNFTHSISVPIIRVERVLNTEPVYNLTIEGDHSYIVGLVSTFNSIQTARRAAAPVKVAKLGNAQNGWIPGPEHERRLLELLAQAEVDPQSWLVYHYGVDFQLVGAPDRAMNIGREWDTIERIKLIALGISKSFLTGEVTYACLTGGTRITMADGTTKPIEDVAVGDDVMDRFYQPQTVLASWCEGEPETLIGITPMGHDTINGTATHRWPAWVWDGPEAATGQELEIRADQLSEGDFVMVPLASLASVGDLIPDIGTEPARGQPWQDGQHLYLPIVRISRYGNAWGSKVYNLTVANTHSYIANGVATYNSAATGLQVFMQRLRSMRTYFENSWIYPKFFQPIATMHGWVRPKPSELAHGFRVKRSPQELMESGRYIIPKMVWDRKLDSSINMEVINAMQSLEQLGVKFSKTTKMATIGHSFEEETTKIHRELEYEKQFLPDLQQAAAAQGGGDAMGGMMGGGAPPIMPLDDMGAMGDGDMGGMDSGEMGDMEAPADAGGEMPMEASRRTAEVKRQKTINGVVFKIEYEKGDIRRGVGAGGKKWARKMKNAYGYIPLSRGVDGECLDIYLNEHGKFDNVYIIHQRKKDGTYDEDKVMVGYPSKAAARRAFLSDMPKWALGEVTTMPWDDWVSRFLRVTKKPRFASQEVSGSGQDLLKAPIWRDGRYKNWTADEVADLLELVETGDTQSPFWSRLLSCECAGPHRARCQRRALLKAFDSEDWDVIWQRVRRHLEDSGYPNRDIDALAEILVKEGKVDEAANIDDWSMIDALADDDDPSLYVGRY